MHSRKSFHRPALVATLVLALAGTAGAGAASAASSDRLQRSKHIVVIYQENHSFDNLWGSWEGVRGLSRADAAHTLQVKQDGTMFRCLPQDDVNLTAPDPLSDQCQDTNPTDGSTFRSHFFNARRTSNDGNPYEIDRYIPATARTCPDPSTFGPPNGVRDPNGLPGGCTRDLVHRFYQEQYQLDGGKQDRYTTGSDALGLTQGHYATRSLPLYRYLHRRGHPRYAISDAFFQAAFGGSFLNHQWLIAARTPFFTGAPTTGADDQHSITDTNGMPTSYPFYKATGAVKDSALTVGCPSTPAQHSSPPRDAARGNAVCGDWAVNTIQAMSQPFAPGTAPARRLPPQTAPTIGDRLSAAGRTWAWYSGGWSNADGRVGEPGWTNGTGPVTRDTNPRGCPDPRTKATNLWPFCADSLFQYHHQPFNYYAPYARSGANGEGPAPRARMRHLRDEAEFLRAARNSRTRCRLRNVSFVKPIGAENEHPGYASEPHGSDHLVSLLRAVERGACRRNTMVIVTYDEFGGQWDHMTPPGLGGRRGVHDAWGPGTRIPALTIAPGLRGRFVVDRKRHDTTSVIATIERRFGLRAVATRDAAVNDMSTVFGARRPR
ncbi:MAG TPA: alkaline phosphatase family protein [Thermoleophilaceae bacterium]|nr:alkaline phosphatase family protein [Thermoleophilaceae bacterium]